MTPAPDDTATQPPLSWLAAAVVAACSWTWCIGMFLPVLLVRDFGLGGWIVFAIPNVIGAASVGWVMCGPAHSRQLLQNNARMFALFALVTIAFHAFFATWMIDLLAGAPIGSLAITIAIVLALLAPWRSLESGGMAGLVLLVSLAIAIAVFALAPASAPAIVLGPQSATLDLVALTMVCTLGFLTCPFLDPTLQQVRGRLSGRRQARLGFSAGFGFFFLAMIAFTLWYGLHWHALTHGRMIAIRLIALHMAIQSAYTVQLHLQWIRRSQSASSKLFWAAGVAVVCVSALLGIRSQGTIASPISAGGESIYRIFLGFYALLFPAYVWLCLLPAGRRRAGPIVLVLTIAIALPFFAMGFVGRNVAWAGPGVLIVILAKFLPWHDGLTGPRTAKPFDRG